MTAARAILALAAVLGGALPAFAATPPTFERDVLPILTSNCLGCHGGLKQKGGLDMRSIPLMLKGGEAGAAVKAGDPGQSKLWKAVETDEMPEGDKKLSAAERQTLRDWIVAGLPTSPPPAKEATSGLAGDKSHAPAVVAAEIDRQIELALSAQGLKPAARADDAEFLRRVYADLAGRVPTAAQAAAFLDDAAPDKRAKLIDALLASGDFGQQFGRTWRDWIAPPELPSDPNGGKQPHNETQALGKWIGERITAGDKWDQIARKVIGVEGVAKDNPQVVFHALQGEGGKTQPGNTARGVASLFMGVQIQCAQCHDDPYRVLSQDDFWALAAFFRKANGDFGRVYEIPPPEEPRKKKDEKKDDKPVDPKKLEEERKRQEEQRKKDEQKRIEAAKKLLAEQGPNGSIAIPKAAFKNAGKIVPGRFFGTDRKLSPASEAEPLRPAFLDWLVAKDNPYFARSFANRTWFYFFNRGIVNPVDDFREQNPPTHPGLLALLASEFTASGYDVKHLVRCVCNSAAYQRTSRAASGGEDELARTRLTQSFGQMPLRVMPADTLYDSLRQVYGDPKLDLRPIDPKDGNTVGESAAVGDAYLEFRRSFCTNEEDAADFTHGIPQLLTLINHPRLTGPSKALEEVLRVKDKNGPPVAPEKVIEWLYLSTLSRRPEGAEMEEAKAFVGKSADVGKGYLGVLWMLVNRSEYLMVR